MAKLRRPIDRDRFLAAWTLARLAMSDHLDIPPEQIRVVRRCPTCGQPHGKPRLAGQPPLPLELSISHAGSRVAVAITCGAPVGIDVEVVQTADVAEELAPSVLVPSELRALSRCAATLAVSFTRYWVRKEAVVKATGHGLAAASLNDLEVSAPDELPRLLRWPHDPTLPERLALSDLNPGPGYVASVAVIGACIEVTEHDGAWRLAAIAPRT
jgi:4'-phosphopantetheinyl transferase